MKAETNEHLIKVDQVIQTAKALLSRHAYPDDIRTVAVAGFIDQMIEHRASMLLLVRSDMVGSAFALARSIFESMYRGLWVNFCATDAEIERFEKNDKIGLSMTDMAKAIDQCYHANGRFTDLKNRGWEALCSYTHTGLLQLGRRFTGHQLEPSYTDGEIVEITTTVTTCVLLLLGRFFARQKYPDEMKEAEKLIESYGPAVAKGASS
jgi:hypothetical protein